MLTRGENLEQFYKQNIMIRQEYQE